MHALTIRTADIPHKVERSSGFAFLARSCAAREPRQKGTDRPLRAELELASHEFVELVELLDRNTTCARGALTLGERALELSGNLLATFEHRDRALERVAVRVHVGSHSAPRCVSRARGARGSGPSGSAVALAGVRVRRVRRARPQRRAQRRERGACLLLAPPRWRPLIAALRTGQRNPSRSSRAAGTSATASLSRSSMLGAFTSSAVTNACRERDHCRCEGWAFTGRILDLGLTTAGSPSTSCINAGSPRRRSAPTARAWSPRATMAPRGCGTYAPVNAAVFSPDGRRTTAGPRSSTVGGRARAPGRRQAVRAARRARPVDAGELGRGR